MYGYVAIRRDRRDGGGGGCVTFIKQGTPQSTGYRKITGVCDGGSIGGKEGISGCELL